MVFLVEEQDDHKCKASTEVEEEEDDVLDRTKHFVESNGVKIS